MNYLTDDETAAPPDTGAQRDFAFNGIPLIPYSRMVKAADVRLSFDGSVSVDEDAICFVYLMTSANRNPKGWKSEIDSIRGAGCGAFRVKAFEWAEANINTPELLAEARRLSDDVRIAALGGSNLDVEKDPSKPGNA